MANDLSVVKIISKKHGENATTEDYNSGKAAIGTGPYKFKQYVKGDKIVLEKNSDYFGKNLNTTLLKSNLLNQDQLE